MNANEPQSTSESRSRRIIGFSLSPAIASEVKQKAAKRRMSVRNRTPRTESATPSLHILDPKRFPWIAEDRDPSDTERQIATVASAALMAAQKVQTKRRSDAKADQEEAVKQLLRDMDFTEVGRREIRLLRDAPAPGEFCAESKLGGSRADLVAGLYDRRVMALECKASNSEVNSFKRVNHEAAGKARAWIRDFGNRQVVPGAVLAMPSRRFGDFRPATLATGAKTKS